MSETQQSPRETLARLAERYRISKATLRLIAQAINPSLADSEPPDERTIASVNDAIEVLVLSGLDSEQLISRAITEQRERGGESWRDELWRTLLAAANDEWERRGRPDPPLGTPLHTVAPIEPQPVEEIEADEGQDPLAA